MSHRRQGSNERYFHASQQTRQPPNQQTSQQRQNEQQQQQRNNQRSRYFNAGPAPSSFGRGGPFDNRAYQQRNNYNSSDRRPNNSRNNNYNNNYNNNNRNNYNNPYYSERDKEKDEPMLDSKDNDSYRRFNNYSCHNDNNNQMGRRSSDPYPQRYPNSASAAGSTSNNHAGGHSRGVSQAQGPNWTVSREPGPGKKDDEQKWAPKRKGRDYVKGGRIAKRKRTEEYDVDQNVFRCDICDLEFREFCEKLAHDESRDHINKKDERRAEIMQQQYQPWNDRPISQPLITKPANVRRGDRRSGQQHSRNSESYQKSVNALNASNGVSSGDNQNSESQNAVDALIHELSSSLEDDDIPTSFKTWAHKSMVAAQEKGKRNKDPHIAGRVRKELMFELARSRKLCILHRLNWNRQLLCTGSMMERKNSNTIRLTSMEKLVKMDAQAKQRRLDKLKGDAVDVDAPSVGATGNQVNTNNTSGNNNTPGGYGHEQNDSQSAHTRTTRQSVANAQYTVDNNQLGQSYQATLNDNSSIAPNNPSTTTPTQTTAAEGQGIDMNIAIQEEQPQRHYVFRQPPSIIGERVRSLAIFGMNLDSDVVLNYHYERSKGILRSTVDKPKPDIEQYSAELETLTKDIVKGARTDYDKMGSDLQRITKVMEDADTHPRIVQECMKQQLNLAFRREDYNAMTETASKLMKSYNDFGCGRGLQDEVQQLSSALSDSSDVYIAVFLLSVLFRGPMSSRLKAARTPTRGLCEMLRLLPKNALKMDLVRTAMNSLSALMSNNWLSFFAQYEDMSMHFDSVSLHMDLLTNLYDTYVPVVRERAFMTLLATPCGDPHPPLAPALISMGDIMGCLGYARKPEEDFMDPADAEEDIPFLDAVEFINSLPRKLTLLGETDEGRHVMLRGTQDTAAIHSSAVVNVPLLNLLLGKKMEIIA